MDDLFQAEVPLTHLIGRAGVSLVQVALTLATGVVHCRHLVTAVKTVHCAVFGLIEYTYVCNDGHVEALRGCRNAGDGAETGAIT